MLRLFLLLIVFWGTFAGTLADSAGALAGAWKGQVRMGIMSVPVVFNFDRDAAGSPVFTLDSPQQNATGIPVEVLYLSTDSISVSIPWIEAEYNGRISATSVSGTLRQRGVKRKLRLVPAEPAQVQRPQTPVAPFPYQQVDTVFSASDGTLLAGTLLLSDKVGEDTPMVVMVTGSGPQNRDEEIFGHKPFAVIADYLARNGIASFRYDDRGVARSQGDFASATLRTFLADAESALMVVRGMNRFGQVGILGHSEGGTIAMLLAADKKPDFIISLAGMAIEGKQTILWQNRHSLENTGMAPEDIEGNVAVIDAVFTDILSRGDEAATTVDVDSIATAMDVEIPPRVMQSLKANVGRVTPYFRELLAVNASALLKDVCVPFLALNGELDTQVDATANLDAICANCRSAEVRSLPGLNHLFQHAKSGEVSEYSSIRETISEEVLTIITDFINALPKVPCRSGSRP